MALGGDPSTGDFTSIGADAATGAAVGGPWGAAIGAGVGILGDVLGFAGGQSTNAAQIALAQQQMAFQKDLATNAMQYRVADLKKAGLNPMLAVSGGGAQAMPGAMAQLQNPGMAFQGAGAQVTSALGLQTQQAQIDLMKSQSKQASASADYTSGPQSEQANASAYLQRATADILVPAQAQAAKAAAQLSTAEQDRIRQQIDSGDIAEQIRLMKQQGNAADAAAYASRAMGLVNQMGAIQAQYGMYFAIQKIAAEAQLMNLKIPEAQAFANYIQSEAGKNVFLQRQVESALTTGASVYQALKPGAGINTFQRGVGPGGMGAGAPNWPVNP